MLRFLLLCLLALACALGSPVPSWSAYPEKPIHMIVPFDAGGGTDVMARTFVPFLERAIGPGAKVVIVNKPGASGLIGYTEIARAAPDGYTIGTLNMPGGITLYIQGTAHYTLDKLTPLGCLVNDSMMLNVAANSPFKNVREFFDYAAANPGKVSIGFGGIGAAGHLSLLLFQQKPEFADLKFTIVPFPGGAPARAALLGGHITATLQTISEASAFIEEGQIRALGVESEQRSTLLPDIPTFEEQGISMIYGASRGFVAPAGLPQDIKEILETAIAKAAQDPEFIALATRQSLELEYMDAKTYGQHLKSQESDLKALWNDTPWVQR